MTKETALELAAQAWCKEETKDKVMDPTLCNAFADILQHQVHLAVARLGKRIFTPPKNEPDLSQLGDTFV